MELLDENLPEEWEELLDKDPDLKDYFLEESEMSDCFQGIPENFFTYGYETYFSYYSEYKPFFTCFEKGEEVFANFYEIYGTWDEDDDSEEQEDIRSEENEKKLKDSQLIEIANNYINGMNYILSMGEEEIYDLEQLKTKVLTVDDFEEEYDTEELEEDQEEFLETISSIMLDTAPDDNFLSEFYDSLYELTLDYNVIHYILWPIYKKDNIKNPFQPYIELWDREINLYITDDEILVVCPENIISD